MGWRRGLVVDTHRLVLEEQLDLGERGGTVELGVGAGRHQVPVRDVAPISHVAVIGQPLRETCVGVGGSDGCRRCPRECRAPRMGSAVHCTVSLYREQGYPNTTHCTIVHCTALYTALYRALYRCRVPWETVGTANCGTS